MGIFCSPCCCVCGKSPMDRLDHPDWLQDFCPKHKPKEYVQYLWGLRVDNGKYIFDKKLNMIIYENEKLKRKE